MSSSNIDTIMLKVINRLYEKGLIPVEISARHTHLCIDDVEKLFGKNHKLTCKRDLSQPGECLAEERIRLKGPKGVINNVAVLGPERKSTQVEISVTDARALGIKPVVALSGNLENAVDITIETDLGQVTGKAIVAKRHIHMTKRDAARVGVKDGDIVKVQMLTDRPVIFEDTVIRVNDNFSLAMHIDFDEANACNLSGKGFGLIIK